MAHRSECGRRLRASEGASVSATARLETAFARAAEPRRNAPEYGAVHFAKLVDARATLLHLEGRVRAFVRGAREARGTANSKSNCRDTRGQH